MLRQTSLISPVPGLESSAAKIGSEASATVNRIVAFLLLVVVSAAAAAGQTDRVQFVEQIDVGLTELKVVVSDADGRPVRGLTRDDFELLVGRTPVEITHFAAFENRTRVDPTSESTPTEPALRWLPDDRMNLVIYLDYSFLEPGEIEDVKEALLAFLGTSLQPKDRSMLVVANHSLDIIQAPTTVPQLIVRAITNLENQTPRGHAMREFPRILSEIERIAQAGSDIPSFGREQQPALLKARIESFADEIYRELELTTHPFHRLLPTLAGLVGRTELIYIGGTLPTDAAQRLFAAWRAAFGPSSAYRQSRSSFEDDGGFSQLDTTSSSAAASAADAGQLFAEVTDLANRHGVTLHVLDTGGLRRSRGFVTSRGATMTERGASDSLGQSIDTSKRSGNPQILQMMAHETGGRALVNSRSFGDALTKVEQGWQDHYLLAFSQTPERSLQKVTVELLAAVPGANVEHRAAIKNNDADRLAADKVVSALILGIAENPLAIELVADALTTAAPRNGSTRLPLKIYVPTRLLTFVDDGTAFRGQFSLYLTSGDLRSGASGVQKTTVPLTFTHEQMADATARPIEYRLELEVKAGARAVAVTVRDDLRPIDSTATLVLAEPIGTSPATASD